MPAFVEFHPWSASVVDNLLHLYQQRRFRVLDIGLSARCNLRTSGRGCIYCDSVTGKPDPREFSEEKLISILREAHELEFNWIYICGLGEPTNDPRFKSLISFAAEHGMSLCFFSNGIGFTKEYVSFLCEFAVNVIVKCDSLKPATFNRLLGASEDCETAESIYESIQLLLSSNCGTNYDSERFHTALALSIVPTRENLADIPNIVRLCVKHQIFPLIAQLEYSGVAKDHFETLSPSLEELFALKITIEEITGHPYEVPVCPAGICGLHISNIGDCIVDKKTGLSCPWFRLIEPELTTIGNVRNYSLLELTRMVLDYRDARIGNVEAAIAECCGTVFGGCGGEDLLKMYQRIHKRV